MIRKSIFSKRNLFTVVLFVLAIITVLLIGGKPEDIRSLKSIPISDIKSKIKESPSIHYERLSDVSLSIENINLPIDWKKDFTKNRSSNYQLHAWHMLNGRLIKYDTSHKIQYLEDSFNVALDWVRQNKVSYKNNQKKSFAWYDMAVGLRAYRLAYILDQSIRHNLGRDKEYKILWDSLADHLIYLSDNNNIIFHNNHGIYQAAGQKSVARRFKSVSKIFEGVIKQADIRIAAMMERQFTKDGVHKEHSPYYHRMVYLTFQELLKTGLMNNTNNAKLSKIGNATYWMIKPDGVLVEFGDTERKVVPKQPNKHDEGAELLTYYLSDGKMGEAPESPFKVFHDSGFSVVKTGQSYLAQEAAFFSRTHKHADDLTFNWYEGRDILIDSGKYGYKGKTDPKSADALAGFWYSDPKRQYVESTRAHNTVEIDGMNDLRRGRKPFGSAIVDSGKVAENVYFIRTKVTEFKTITYDRTLIYSPGKWLAVVDDLDDSENKTRDYKQWFQFAPDLEISKAGKELVVRNVGKTALRAVSLLEGPDLSKPIRGQKTPRLQGWYSKNANHFEPTTSVSFDQSGEGAEFVTLFAFSGSPVSFDARSNTIDTFSWTTGGSKHTISIDKKPKSTHVDFQTK